MLNSVHECFLFFADPVTTDITGKQSLARTSTKNKVQSNSVYNDHGYYEFTAITNDKCFYFCSQVITLLDKCAQL